MQSITIPPSTPSPPFACPPPHQKPRTNRSSLPSPPPSTERVSTRGPSAPVLQALDLFREHRNGCALVSEWTRLILAPMSYLSAWHRTRTSRDTWRTKSGLAKSPLTFGGGHAAQNAIDMHP